MNGYAPLIVAGAGHFLFAIQRKPVSGLVLALNWELCGGWRGHGDGCGYSSQ